MMNAIRLGGTLPIFSRFKKHGQYMQSNFNQISATHSHLLSLDLSLHPPLSSAPHLPLPQLYSGSLSSSGCGR